MRGTILYLSYKTIKSVARTESASSYIYSLSGIKN